jgi:hypothetical protein
MAHWSYVQAQAHPLESDSWLQVAYWVEAMCWMTPGVVVGWWCHRLMRSAAGPHIHEHSGRRFEQHATGKWLQHMHDEETGELATLKVCADEPPGVRPPEVKLGSGQRLKRAR